MKAKVIALTQPVGDFPGKTAEDIIAYCARVSNPSNQGNFDTAHKLLDYLTRNKHWSPFEMAHAVIEIETTRDIARQILRHRSFAFQEFSQRYADPTDLGIEIREARLQDTKNRQNSIENDDMLLNSEWYASQHKVFNMALTAYKWALGAGVAKEVARAVLPEGLIVSRLYMSGSIRSWIHYVQVRKDITTQKEHRIIAEECRKILEPHFEMMKYV